MRTNPGVAIAAVLVVCGGRAHAADPIDYDTAHLDRHLAAQRTTGPIQLDGVLDEPDWRQAPVASSFIQTEPKEGEPASEDTEVRLLYDDDNMYIGVFAHDSDPSGIIVSELKKDFATANNDLFQVVLDTFHDGRNGYQFAVNALGAKWDAQMTNEGRQVNSDWDAVWDVRTRLAETGWYAEIRIPFRSMRFGDGPSQTWGVNFLRRVRRRNEDSFWSPIPRNFNLNRVSLAGTVQELRNLRRGNDLRVKPYAALAGTRIRQGPTVGDFDTGVDVKYGITSGLTWDFTVHTDFSQVEADTQQVNLTRFSLLFPEKREFFLENSGVFQFGAATTGGGGGGGGGGVQGRQNQVGTDIIMFFSRRIGLSDDARAIPITAGTRLTGSQGAYSVGVLNIQQAEQGTSLATNFTALRLRRDILKNSDVGVMFLNKDVAGSHYNRVIAADANFRITNDLDVDMWVGQTFSPASALKGNTDAFGGRVGFNYNSRTWDIWGNYQRMGDGFNNEMGFAPRTGIDRMGLNFSRAFRPKRYSRWIREIRPHWIIYNISRHNGLGLETRYQDVHLPLTLQNGTNFEVGSNPSTDVIFTPFTINRRRGIVIAPGRYDYNEWFYMGRFNPAARLSYNLRFGHGSFYDGYRKNFEAQTTARLNEMLNVTMSLSRNLIDLKAGSYTTNLITSRINANFSTRMFLNALLQYNTDARQWTSNIRFNVIHRPLSDIFLVFNESRDSRTNDLLDRSIAAKITYMLAF